MSLLLKKSFVWKNIRSWKIDIICCTQIMKVKFELKIKVHIKWSIKIYCTSKSFSLLDIESVYIV